VQNSAATYAACKGKDDKLIHEIAKCFHVLKKVEILNLAIQFFSSLHSYSKQEK
jgi:hypothetical protein